jgi:two-component system, chemotaxis family, CheB/CheR fusion protein
MMDTCPVVAVASDASDLEAVSELLSALSADCSGSFIIVQHVDEGRKKSLAATIAQRTNLSVMLAHDDVKLERGHLYLVPPDATLAVAGDRIRVMPKEKARGPYHPGDVLFASLADELLVCAIGVVLSGAGFDGTAGVRAIRRSGGVTFAQYPGSARFSSMPISAIDTGCVDFVLRPYEIARELRRFTDRPMGLAQRPLVVDRNLSGPIV